VCKKALRQKEMPELKQRIVEDMKSAMKAKDKEVKNIKNFFVNV
jgi:hypothetical protein